MTTFHFDHQELIRIFTIFVFLMILRIADDFKDYETDRRLFLIGLCRLAGEKKDLAIALSFIVAVSVLFNILFMNNIGWFLFLYIYGTLMSFWFFKRDKIQNSLLLALVTHNPVMMILNLYTISFVCYKYNLPLLSLPTVLLAFTMYFPSLIWEVCRKIRAPKDETEYVTYLSFLAIKSHSLYRGGDSAGYLDQFRSPLEYFHVGVVVLVLNVIWMTVQFEQFIKDPTRFNIRERVERYTYITGDDNGSVRCCLSINGVLL